MPKASRRLAERHSVVATICLVMSRSFCGFLAVVMFRRVLQLSRFFLIFLSQDLEAYLRTLCSPRTLASLTAMRSVAALLGAHTTILDPTLFVTI